MKEYPGTAISSALNEQLIAGIAAGCGMADDKARCGEIQFVDYHQSATQTIRLAARIYYQSFGDWNCPMLLRMKAGSGGGGPISDSGSGGGAFGHSNAGEQWFTNVPGLITICPSTPYDAKGLLIEASRSQSPVVFLERGRLYRADAPTVHEGWRAHRRSWPSCGTCPMATTPSRSARRARFASAAAQAHRDSRELGHDGAGVGDRGGALRRGRRAARSM